MLDEYLSQGGDRDDCIGMMDEAETKAMGQGARAALLDVHTLTEMGGKGVGLKQERRVYD